MSDLASISTTEQRVIPIRDYCAPYAREQMAAALRRDDPQWDQNTPIEEFREKFKLTSNNDITPDDIKNLASLSNKIVTAEDCQPLLDAVGGLIQKSRNVAIKFREQGARLLRKPPEGTLCRPDIIAFNQKRFMGAPDELSSSTSTQVPSDHVTIGELTWAQIEATAEFLSAGDNQQSGLAKAITYTAYHLLSRPDRVIVPGFFFSRRGFSLIFTGASGTCHTDLKWNDQEHLQLLCEFVDRIFFPSPDMIDPLIVRNTDDTFDISLKEKTYPRCKILFLGRAIGRRTTIFETNERAVPIIKEQYLMSPSPEAGLLKKLLGVPGVVRLHDHQEYRTGGQVIGCTIGEKPRYKTRLALKDKGEPIRESKTPEEFLERLYDVLETAQYCYEEGVLHRDFSINNVLFREPTITEESRNSTYCSVRHLLDPAQERIKTGIVLIDLEHGTDDEIPTPLESAGTPLFQARATLHLAPLDPVKILAPGMPDLVPEALQRYHEIRPERLKQFPPDDNDYRFKATPEASLRLWYHVLRHDIESLFWVFFVWAVELRPDNNLEVTEISRALWSLLVSTAERGEIILMATNPQGKKWLDPAYAPLEDLLRELASHLINDLHWVSADHPPQMGHPSYLREVFQRCIFNFLVKNKEQPFLRQERHPENRKVEKIPFATSSLSSLQVSSRQSMGSKSGDSVNSRRSLKRGREEGREEKEGRGEKEGSMKKRRGKTNKKSDAGSEYSLEQ